MMQRSKLLINILASCIILLVCWLGHSKSYPSLVLVSGHNKVYKDAGGGCDQDFRTSGYTDSFCNKTLNGLDFVPLSMQRAVRIKFFCFGTLFSECTIATCIASTCLRNVTFYRCSWKFWLSHIPPIVAWHTVIKLSFQSSVSFYHFMSLYFMS